MPEQHNKRENYITKASKVHLNKYNYSLWPPNIIQSDKVQIICPFHGEFVQLLNSHLSGRGCRLCANIKIAKANHKPLNHYIQLATEIHHNKYDYSLWPVGIKTTSTVPIICIKHGKFSQRLSDHLSGHGCMKCGKLSTITSHRKSLTHYIQLANEIHHNKYDYSLWPTIVLRHDIVCNICPIHGEYKQRLNKHLNGHGCSACGISKRRSDYKKKHGVEHPRQLHLDKKAISLLKNKKWLKHQHHELHRSSSDIAAELGIDASTVHRHMHSFNIEIKYFFQSIDEKKVRDFVSSLGVDIISNSRQIIPPKELDIYIPSHNVAIEYCGLYWHSEQRGKDRNYHKQKLEMCQQKGIQLLTIFNDEWEEYQTQVKNKIRSLLGKLQQEQVYARKTNIVTVDNVTKCQFFEQHHIQGNGPSSINIGLLYQNNLVAIMGFIKQKNQHYLNRYATSCIVPGGFSKLLKHFQQTYDWNKIISFADLRWSDGGLYEKTGFVLEQIIPPDYSYSTNGRNRFHKFNFRRKNLPSLLSTFDPNKSEWENCKANKILRIWDCGKIRYVLTP